jgi:sulfatase modifying factor 1
MRNFTLIMGLRSVLFWIVCLWVLPHMNAFSQDRGDVNADSFINPYDGLLVKDHILDRNPLDGDFLIRADAFYDGKINVADIVTIDINSTFSIPMIHIPSGAFIMGARDDGDDLTYRISDELPRHEVTLSAYYIGKYEMTNGQCCRILNWAKEMGYLENSTGGSYTEGDVYKNGMLLLEISSSFSQIACSGGLFSWKSRETYSMEWHPVVMVSWYGAAACCNWLSEMEGRTSAYDLSTWELVNKTGAGYRLPTEAEWERAAAWDGSKHWIYGYTSDNGNNTNRYNHYDELGGTQVVNPLNLTTYPFTSPVGWFNGKNISPKGSIQTIDSPSPVGCYDMSGNVLEWCHDWLGSTYYEGGAMIDPTGPALGTYRINRGGNANTSERYCRSASRHVQFNTPSERKFTIGFRACLQKGGN